MWWYRKSFTITMKLSNRRGKKNMNLSDKIVELRKKNGFSQEDLADELQVSRQAVSRWEQGTTDPSSSNILELSKLFNVTTDYLLNDDYHSDEDLPKIIEIRKDNLQQIVLYFVLLEIICFLLQVASIIVLQNDLYGILCIILFITVIIIFEYAYHKKTTENSLKIISTRKKFYTISTWIGLYFPTRLVVTGLSAFYPRPYSVITLMIIILVVYVILALFISKLINTFTK